ncbi:uncharacterized protein TRIREDRAFT_81331 [Trichoderma reesei QM6a]|uniref:Predicted protein n=1 Tax=Hypocrea jecorina (strain QM6a) TaxID=431241 RepID=G0RTL0_HYPJQ|nr:uncharacterized protein TRIREDRAFT_81331 [Trichoderma reesei QM6a]EGR45451.1 predicted protein [Trichoderma reesei QM6a]
MKSAVLLAAGALLVSAVPLEKRVMETDWVTDIVTVTVTVDPNASPSATPTAGGPSPPPAPASSSKPAPSLQPVVAKPSPAPSSKPAPSPKPAPSSAAPAPAPAPSSGGSDYGSIMVDQHNVHRANHSSPALEWDDTLAGYAQITAQGCVFAHDMSEGGGGYGQNLASWGSTGDIDDKQLEAARRGVTDQWYNDEMENWTFYGLANPPSGTNLDSWGHYTQLIWKSSTKVGCYTAKCPAGTVLSMQSWYTVCNYSPPGNFGGRYAENVLKPLGQPTVRI